MTRSHLLFGAAIAVALLGTSPAFAATLNLDFDSFADGGQDDFFDDTLDEGDTAFAVTGPVAITFTNLVTSSGAPFADIDGDGIYFSRDANFDEVVSVDLTFSVNTIIKSVDIDFTEATPGSFFELSGINGTSGQIAVDAPGDILFDMGSISVFLAGKAYTLTHNLFGADNFFQIDEFDVAAIPLPAGGALLLSGLFGFAALRRVRAG